MINERDGIKVLRIVEREREELDEEFLFDTSASLPQTKFAELAAIQTEAMKQIAVVLNKFIYLERKMEIFTAELETLSDEIIFLRKEFHKLRNHEQDRKYQKIITRIETLEKEQIKDRLHLALKSKQIKELQEQAAKPRFLAWWKKILPNIIPW